MDETSILDNFVNPSIMHWYSLGLGQWVYALTGADVAITHPVSTLMLLIAAMNIVAIFGLMCMIVFIGGKGIFSGAATANILAGQSPFTVLRVSLGLLVIMPTTYGVSKLAEHNVHIGNGQVGVAYTSIWGGAVADTLWQLSGSGALQYNISSNHNIRNTYGKSRSLAFVFVCNEFYYQTVGKDAGQNRFYINELFQVDPTKGSMKRGLRGVDSLSDVEAMESHSDYYFTQEIYFGGKAAACGSVALDYLATASSDEGSVLDTISNNLFLGLTKLKAENINAAVNRYMVELRNFEQFADRYYRAFSALSYKDLRDTVADQKGDNAIEPDKVLNIGALQNGYGDKVLQNEIARATDALNYLTLRQSYFEKAEGELASESMLSTFSGTTDGSSTSSFSNMIYDKYLNGWVSAGSYWAIFQGISDILYGVERHINGITVKTNDISDVQLCQKAGFFGSIGSAINKRLDKNEPSCESAGHVLKGFDVILAHSSTKGQVTDSLPDTISVNGKTYPVDTGMWASYFVPTPQSKQDLAFFTKATIWVVESIWGAGNWLNFGESGVLLGSVSDNRSMLSATENSIMLDLHGTTSPYALLNQMGENTRDLAYSMRMASRVLEAFFQSLKLNQEGRVLGMNVWTGGASSILMLIPETFARTIILMGNDLISALSQMYWALTLTSLIAMYGIPLIPSVGWVFILIGVFFTLYSAQAAIPLTAILMAAPKGDGMFAPDTERILSLLFGIFLRQSLIVIGFWMSLTLGYVGLSILNVVWLTTFVNKLSSAGVLDNVLSTIIFFVGYAFVAFYICLYTFRTISMLVDVVGNWFSSIITGGAFGSNAEDYAAAQNGITGLSQKMDELKGAFENNSKKKNTGSQPSASDAKDPKTKKSEHSETNA
ncbi:hypothetical protein [Vibrio agarivorans]|uniref:hypothetical protein n=1 Tax=Vibrio agarivorans TaxID=153622 RepID=UPI0025B30D7A|nr:hypothetical protein [Vibrio agarivorans]MDN3661091.1 hypothetical protein [Vibrio agarivorans]